MQSREQCEALRQLLRRELEGGCCNDVVPWGIQSLRDGDYVAVPPSIFNILRRYPYLDKAARGRVLTIVDVIVSGGTLSNSDALWLLHLNVDAKYEVAEEWRRNELPVVLAECRPDEPMQNRQRLLRRFGKAPAVLQSIALAFYRLPHDEQENAIALAFKAIQEETISPDDLQWAHRNRLPPLVKANVRSWGERIYHVPGGEFYDVTDVAWFADEGLFYTEEQAESKGWRRSSR